MQGAREQQSFDSNMREGRSRRMSSRGVTRRGAKANHSPSSALKSRGDSALPVLGPDAKLGEKVSRPLQVHPRHIGKPSQHAVDIGIDICTLANARQGQPVCFNGLQVMQCTCDGEEKGPPGGVAEEEGGVSGACVGVGNRSMDVKPAQTLLCQYLRPSWALILESGACEAFPWSRSDMSRLGQQQSWGWRIRVRFRSIPNSLWPGWWCGEPVRRGAGNARVIDLLKGRAQPLPVRHARHGRVSKLEPRIFHESSGLDWSGRVPLR